MDHHCTWLGTCIGKRNYAHFFWFSVGIMSCFVYTCITGLVYMAFATRDMADDPDNLQEYHLWLMMKRSPFILLFEVYTAYAIIITGMLVFYHLTLISTLSTTQEEIKEVYKY